MNFILEEMEYCGLHVFVQVMHFKLICGNIFEKLKNFR